MDYSLYYREEITIDSGLEGWDLFISAFNSSERLRTVYNAVETQKKYWLVFPEYGFTDEELPHNDSFFIIEGKNESEQIQQIISVLELTNYKNSSVCIDSTGFMRPQLLFFLFYFKTLGFKKIDFLYSEPDSYSNKEKTKFSYGAVIETRTVSGYAGISKPTDGKDLLIIASGYDSSLIEKVAQFNENSDIIHIIGFPSLKPDMYQENMLRTLKAADSFPDNTILDPVYAPAADPFETAAAIKKLIEKKGYLNKYRHIYLSPLSTKAQTLGVGLAYLNDFAGQKVSVIYPFTGRYSKETSIGLSKLWKYTFEFD